MLLAWASMKLLGRFTGTGVSLACFFAVLFLPTVFLNSAVWAQCDSSYAALLVLGLYLALEDKPFSLDGLRRARLWLQAPGGVRAACLRGAVDAQEITGSTFCSFP